MNSNLNIIIRGDLKLIKKICIIIILIIIFIVGILVFNKYNKYQPPPDIKIPVLLYHNFVTSVPDNDPDNFNYINTPQSFEENIKTILEDGYTIISMSELDKSLNGELELPSKPILITFDDGYYSNYEYIYPILQKYNAKVSIFVVTDKVGKEINGIKYLGWDECLEMQNSGLAEIFSHSKKHVFYDKLPVRKVRDVVLESYKIIEENLGKKDFKAFAYPYGAYTNETVWALKINGIDFQIYDIGINYFSNFNKDFIKRINVPCEMTGKEIIEEIQKTN